VTYLEDNTVQTGVIEEQVGTLANDNQRDSVTVGKTNNGGHLVGARRFNQKIRRTPYLPAGVLGERRIENTGAYICFRQQSELLWICFRRKTGVHCSPV
jgi:hypothetical protein